jgi:hypothetical protein
VPSSQERLRPLVRRQAERSPSGRPCRHASYGSCPRRPACPPAGCQGERPAGERLRPTTRQQYVLPGPCPRAAQGRPRVPSSRWSAVRRNAARHLEARTAALLGRERHRVDDDSIQQQATPHGGWGLMGPDAARPPSRNGGKAWSRPTGCPQRESPALASRHGRLLLSLRHERGSIGPASRECPSHRTLASRACLQHATPWVADHRLFPTCHVTRGSGTRCRSGTRTSAAGVESCASGRRRLREDVRHAVLGSRGLRASSRTPRASDAGPCRGAQGSWDLPALGGPTGRTGIRRRDGPIVGAARARGVKPPQLMSTGCMISGRRRARAA